MIYRWIATNRNGDTITGELSDYALRETAFDRATAIIEAEYPGYELMDVVEYGKEFGTKEHCYEFKGFYSGSVPEDWGDMCLFEEASAYSLFTAYYKVMANLYREYHADNPNLDYNIEWYTDPETGEDKFIDLGD